MAATAMRKHSVLLIQSVFRGYQSRRQAKQLRCSNRLCWWLYRVFMARQRRLVAKICIRHAIRQSTASVLRIKRAQYDAAVKIQANHRMSHQYKAFQRQLAVHRTTRHVCAHVQLYGSRRAVYRLSKTLRLQRSIYRLLQYYLRMRRLKR